MSEDNWERRDAMHMLALALQYCSHEHETALPLFEECLAVTRRVVGDEHPNTLAIIANLATVHCAMDNLEQALTLGNEAFVVRRRTLGRKHPDTLVSICNLAAWPLFVLQPKL